LRIDLHICDPSNFFHILVYNFKYNYKQYIIGYE
jgi:hypothetical protein